MFKSIRQRFCDHEFSYKGSYTDYSYSGYEVDFHTSHLIRCKHCKKEITSSNFEWLTVKYLED